MPNEFDENHFSITVNDRTYHVNVSYEEVSLTRYEIETNCEYLFTVYTDEEGVWQAEDDVKVLNENLIEEVGRAIEEHGGR